MSGSSRIIALPGQTLHAADLLSRAPIPFGDLLFRLNEVLALPPYRGQPRREKKGTDNTVIFLS